MGKAFVKQQTVQPVRVIADYQSTEKGAVQAIVSRHSVETARAASQVQVSDRRQDMWKKRNRKK